MFGSYQWIFNIGNTAAPFTQMANWVSTSGVVTDNPGTAINSWTSQDSVLATAVSPGRPVYQANQFSSGTKPSVYIEGIGSGSNDFMTLQSKILCPLGFSAFICFKTQNTKTTMTNGSQNPPQTLLGDVNTTNSRNQFGLSNGTLHYRYKVAGTTWTSYNASTTSLNNGNPHTCAIVHTPAGGITIYADNTSVYTGSGATYDTAQTGVANLGVGYNTTDYGYDTGFAQIVIYNGVVDTSTLNSLHSNAVSLYF